MLNLTVGNKRIAETKFCNLGSKIIIMTAVILFLHLPLSVKAEKSDFALKTNILYDAAATLNLGLEWKVAPRWSVDVSGNFISWKPGGKVYKHWLAQPEVRYWFCEATGGHFIGGHLLGGQYNVADLPYGIRWNNDYRYQGWGIGAGVAYGYSWLLGRHWNIEAEIGVGYVWTRYDKFECVECGRKVESGKTRNYVGPTKAALNLVYVF